MVKAAIYARISKDDGTALGVTRQLEDCRTLVEGRSWAAGVEYVDNDTSAFSGRVRPQYEAMMAAVGAGDVGAIVAWHPDRLHRSPLELEGFIVAVEDAGVKVATVQAGELDLSSASGRMTARVVGAVARHESEQKSDRLRRKARQMAESGRDSGGSRPFGFERDRVTVRESEAELLREAVERIVDGASLRSVVMWMAEHSTTAGGRAWTNPKLRRILTSGRIAGLRDHRGVQVSEAVWPAVVDRQSWERCRAILLDDSRRKREMGPPRRYLLTGLLVCGRCGARMVAHPRPGGAKGVACPTGHLRQTVAPMDAMIVEAVLRHLDRPEVSERIDGAVSPDFAAVAAEVAALEARLEALGEAYAAGELDDISWRSARRGVTGRLEASRGRYGAMGAQRVAWAGRGGELREAWPGMGIETRRAVVASVIDRIVVASAVKGRNTFQPERFTVDWR